MKQTPETCPRCDSMESIDNKCDHCGTPVVNTPTSNNVSTVCANCGSTLYHSHEKISVDGVVLDTSKID